MAEQPCPDCGGARLRPESLAVKIGGLSIAEYSALSASAAGKWIRGLELTETERAIARLIVREISERLAFLENVGIGYLSLVALGADPVRGRGPANPARDPDRLEPGRRACTCSTSPRSAFISATTRS